MNCSEFENIVNDLARLKMIDDAGMAHAEVCGRCASRLADERALSVGLKFLAASDERKSAPASVEAALLDAFRARKSNPPARPAPVQSNVRPRRAAQWIIAAAAAILIVFGFIVYSAIQNEPRIDDKVVKEKSPAPRPFTNANEQIMKGNGAPEPSRRSRAPRPRSGNRLQLVKPIIRESMTSYASDNEYTTDFFPLSYSDDQRPMESDDVIRVQVIRVQMPRPALIALGLPVNIERADVPVKADLLVGEDGLARAIRFVR